MRRRRCCNSRLEPEEKFIAAKRALTGTARRWLDSHQGIKSWYDLKISILEEFGRQVKAADVHAALRRRRKKKEESVMAYVQEIEFLASQGGLHRDEVRQYIANGLTEDASIKLTLLAATSRQNILELLETHEKMAKSREWQDRNGRSKPGTKRC